MRNPHKGHQEPGIRAGACASKHGVCLVFASRPLWATSRRRACLVIFRKGADSAGHRAGLRVGRIEGQTAG